MNTEDLDLKLRTLSTKFTLPDRAYALLNRVVKNGSLEELERQFAVLQQKAGENVNTFSIELLTDYVIKGISLNGIPVSPNPQSSNYGGLLSRPFDSNGNRMMPSRLHEDDFYFGF